MKSQELLKLNKQGRKELYLEKRVIMLMIINDKVYIKANVQSVAQRN